MELRESQEIVIDFAAAATLSKVHRLSRGAMGTILVPVGSDAAGKTLQVVATTESGLFADTDLLSTGKTLAAGANAFAADELLEMGAANDVKFKLDSAVSEETRIVLLWKS